MTRRRILVPFIASALLAAACGGDDEADGTAPPAPSTQAPVDTGATDPTDPSVTPTTPDTPVPTEAPTTTAEPTTTTIDPASIALAYAEAGPYPVGVTTLTLDKGIQVEVWYPAVEGTTGEVGYDVRDYTPPAIREILTADIPASYTYPGARDPEAADGTFPVVLFSHGFTGIRVQSSFLTSHLASWGMVVAAPDHPSRDLPNVLGGTASGDRADSIDDLLQTLDRILLEGEGDGNGNGVLAGRVDADHVVAVGHSAGGGTIVGAALDDRIDGYVSLASGVTLPTAPAPDTTGGATGDATTTTVAPAPLPDRPSFFIAGSEDQVISATERTRPSFEAVPAPSLLWILDEVGHNGFDDFCTFGNGTGIIGIAEASGLGGLLDAQPQLRALGEDGCVPPSVPVEVTFPSIRHAVTAWIRQLVGTDAEPVGLGPEFAGYHPVDVTIEVRD